MIKKLISIYRNWRNHRISKKFVDNLLAQVTELLRLGYSTKEIMQFIRVNTGNPERDKKLIKDIEELVESASNCIRLRAIRKGQIGLNENG